jgi:hypothetical protein
MTLPRVQPIIPTWRKEPFDDPEWVFDLDGADLRALPLSERRERLHQVLSTPSPIISEALSVTSRGCELFDLMCSSDLEGIVAKRLADRYDTRVRWLKTRTAPCRYACPTVTIR